MILLFLFAIPFENKNKIYDYGIVSIESISSDGVWLVRGHGAGNGYGSPYQFVFTIVINEDGIAEAKYQILYDKVLLGNDHDNDGFWNGFYVALLKK